MGGISGLELDAVGRTDQVVMGVGEPPQVFRVDPMPLSLN